MDSATDFINKIVESFKNFVKEYVLEVEPLDNMEYRQALRINYLSDYGNNTSWGVDIDPITTSNNKTSNMVNVFLIPKRYSKEEVASILEKSEPSICVTQHHVVSILEKARIHNPRIKVKGTIGNPAPYHGDSIIYKVLTSPEDIKKLSIKLNYFNNLFEINHRFNLVPLKIDKEVKDTFRDLYNEL